MEVTEGVAVFVERGDELILELLDSVADVEGVLEFEEEADTVFVLTTVFEFLTVFVTLPVLVDVLLDEGEPVLVAVLEGVLDCLEEADSVIERRDEADLYADIVKAGDTELLADIVI